MVYYGISKLILNVYIYTQPPKDWELLLAVGAIVLVDVCLIVPLVTLALLDGDCTPIPDKENFPRLNVS